MRDFGEMREGSLITNFFSSWHKDAQSHLNLLKSSKRALVEFELLEFWKTPNVPILFHFFRISRKIFAQNSLITEFRLRKFPITSKPAMNHHKMPYKKSTKTKGYSGLRMSRLVWEPGTRGWGVGGYCHATLHKAFFQKPLHFPGVDELRMDLDYEPWDHHEVGECNTGKWIDITAYSDMLDFHEHVWGHFSTPCAFLWDTAMLCDLVTCFGED